MRDLADKVAWITGGGTGIGEAGAIALAEAGMNVVLSGDQEEPLRAVADAIGERAWVKPLDVTDKDAVNQVASDLLERYGRCDVVVNSAGLNPRERHWHQVTLDDYDLVIRVVLNGVFYTSKAVLPTMIEQQDGLIINISSWSGKYTTVLTG
ncbi:MAG: SDR family NAD(P)-dependent oxidoreductase, partial [Sulfitobacter sp.]|nr:SDR family NAD(P)-dependent oxidoreductase [Sulfitobacter sp.]